MSKAYQSLLLCTTLASAGCIGTQLTDRELGIGLQTVVDSRPQIPRSPNTGTYHSTLPPLPPPQDLSADASLPLYSINSNDLPPIFTSPFTSYLAFASDHTPLEQVTLDFGPQKPVPAKWPIFDDLFSKAINTISRLTSSTVPPGILGLLFPRK